MPEPLLLSQEEAAKRWNVSVKTVYRAIRRGEIQTVKFGVKVMIPVAEVERLAASGWGRKKDDP